MSRQLSRPSMEGAGTQSNVRAVLITADDFGLSEGVSKCIADLLVADVVSRTSVMPCESRTRSLCALYSDTIRGRAGCHLQIHKSRPVLPPERIPSLVNPDGVFKSSAFSHEMSTGEVFSEWMAQVEQVCRYGVEPTHLDTHHHVHQDARFLGVLAEVARRYSLPIRRTGSEELDSMVEAEFVSDHVTKAWTLTGRAAEQLIEELLAAQERNRVIEVVCHPAYPDKELSQKSSACDIRAIENRELWRLPDLLLAAGLTMWNPHH